MNEAHLNEIARRPQLIAVLEPTNAIWPPWIAALLWLIALLEPANAPEPKMNVTLHRLIVEAQPRTESMRLWMF